MKVFVGADHAGFELKQAVIKHLQSKNIEFEDEGADKLDANDDYPHYAYTVATKVLGGNNDDRGILVCGSGQGMAMAANRVRGIRAAVIWSVDGAKAAREDNDSNVLSLPARIIDEKTALSIIDEWLTTPFSKDPKYHRRIDEVEQIYG